LLAFPSGACRYTRNVVKLKRTSQKKTPKVNECSLTA
jgi:hypothetical protein